MTDETWLDEIVREALRDGRDVRLEETKHGVCVTIDGEQVPMKHLNNEWALAWESLQYEVASGINSLDDLED